MNIYSALTDLENELKALEEQAQKEGHETLGEDDFMDGHYSGKQEAYEQAAGMLDSFIRLNRDALLSK